MDGHDDAWAVLGLDPGADRAAVRRAFRRVAQVTHPDRGGDPRAFRRAKAACEALLAVAPPPAPARTPRRAGDPYRGFLAGLDAAARLPVTPAAAVRPRRRPPAAPPAPPRSAERFAAVLAQALAAA